jgi:UTP--glucose-1-phosphate uridylyltransferase
VSSADVFAPIAHKMTAEGLPPVAIDAFRHDYGLLCAGEQGKIPASEIDPVADLPDAERIGDARPAGIAALDRAIVLKLNGGLGTSMGLSRAKSLLPAKDGRSFLDIIIAQTLHLRRSHGCRLPLVLMNSFRTREDSAAVMARYPDLAADVPADFLQHKVPRILAADLTPVTWPANREHEWCPPGHGDIYPALLTSGMLDALLGAGYEYAFVSNADNLGAVLDPDILGWFAQSKAPFLMEVLDRTEADKKGGHLARRRDGRLVLREIAQCPDDEVEAFQDVGRYRWFNANNLWLHLPALADVLRARGGVLGLPLIVNRKSVDPDDPKSPAVVQLETAMGAAIGVFDGARALRVPRARFVPVKTTGDLLLLWSDFYRLEPDFRVTAPPGRQPGDVVVDLDGSYFRQVTDLERQVPKGAPSLARCRRLTVRGDVRFGAGVVVEGDVRVEAPAGEPRTIPDGTRLTS